MAENYGLYIVRHFDLGVFPQHISAPLMEFERQKLVKSYRKDEPSSSDGDGVATEGDPASPAVIIDYQYVPPGACLLAW